MRVVSYPATVELMAGKMRAGEVQKALGISRAVAHYRRRHHGMPASDTHGFIDSGALARFLIESGVKRINWM